MMRKFYSDTAGSIATWFSLSLLGLIVMSGGAVDLAQASSNKAKLQNVADAAALAAIQGNTKSEMRELGMYSVKTNTFMKRSNITMSKVKIRPVIDSSGTRSATVRLTADHKTAFLSLIGIETIKIGSASVVEQAGSNIEFALVLDISFSMAGGKVANLKNSAQKFVDIVMGGENKSDSVSMNIVPFGGNVNLGNSLASLLMPNNVNANWDPSEVDYRNATKSPTLAADALYRFTDGMNCVETKLEDYNTGLIPNHSRSQLPRFLHGNSMLPICPEDSSSTLFNSGTKADLKYKINQLQLSHGTGMDVGAAWGLKSLSPNYRGELGGEFPDRPGDFNGKVKKVLIIMTDGNITGQGRPRNLYDANRFTDPSKMKNKTLYLSGDGTTPTSTDNASGRFKTVCDNAAANGIEVYTIGFKIERGGSADQLLDYCATNSKNYFFVEDNQLNKAFTDIAQSVSEVRIVK